MTNLAPESITALWGKKAANGEPRWLPLIVHLADTAEIGKLLWDEWLCNGAKRNIAENCTFPNISDEYDKVRQARALFIFLCAAHDLGKATPAFQTKDAKPSYAGLNDQRERNERLGQCKDLDDQILKKLQNAGFECPINLLERMVTPHALCSQVLLKLIAGSSVGKAAAILGAHHGKPQNQDPKDSFSDSYYENFFANKTGKTLWFETQQALANWALDYTKQFSDFGQIPTPNQIASVELCGLLIMADWISSNDYLFPYMNLDAPIQIECSVTRAKRGFEKLALTHQWNPLENLQTADITYGYYRQRFEFQSPNKLQQQIVELAISVDNPGMIIVEAPMGYGKTESALAAAEILAKRSGRTGVFFALPTQATSNGIFPRLTSWIRHFGDSRIHSVELFHCRAEFNEDWKKLKDQDKLIKHSEQNGTEAEDEDDTLIVNDWFSGRKKSMLADFVVGTIDQLLMAAFKHKHVMLRHLGLVNKVVIIDECHAYDAYMSVYLERILMWLGKYHIPTIVLSATLPSEKRRLFMEMYLNQPSPTKEEYEQMGIDMPTPSEWMITRDYPIITYNTLNGVHNIKIPTEERCVNVEIEKLEDEQIESKLSKLLTKGGCAGIIVNSVSRAQEFYTSICKKFGAENVILFHSRFLMPDRARIEQQIAHMLGKPGVSERPDFKIIIGTQVLEQSLDIDFDILFTDIAPMDLLIQRIGRLHRHERLRPDAVAMPRCYLLGTIGTINKAATTIYGSYLLMRTLALLPNRIKLPDDISQLVENTYNQDCQITDILTEQYKKAEAVYHATIKKKQDNAKFFRIAEPQTKRRSLNGWLNHDGGNVDESIAVRDIVDSIEVFFVQELDDGMIHLLDDEHTVIARNETPNDDIAREILKYSLDLPLPVIDNNYDKTITILEESAQKLSQYQKSRWLKGNLILILDKDGHFSNLPNYELIYSKSEGLSYRKKELKNV